MAKMPLSKLRSILQAEKADALSAVMASELSAQREKAMKYYLGDVSEDLPDVPDRSVAVSSDVSDTIEGMMPSLMEIFASGDEVVRFDPVGPEDEEAATQETDYVNHVFMQKNPGFLVLYSFIKDALLQKNGIVKVWWSSEERDSEETYTALAEDGYSLLVSDPEIEIVEESTYPDPSYIDPQVQFGMAPNQPQMGMDAGATPAMLHDVRIRTKTTYKCAKVEGVPPEEFAISRRAKSIADAPYCAHERRDRTVADLIADGYDEDSVLGLPVAEPDDTPEGLARDTVDDHNIGSPDLDRMSRPVRVTEHYLRVDYAGDGKPKLHRIVSATDSEEILYRDGKPDIEQVDVAPFAGMTPVIVTHRFFGRSIADLVMDIQRIKTALLRALLDNAYLANNMRTEISESHANKNTIDDLLSNRIGGIVRTKQPGGLNVLQSQSIGPFAFPLIEYMDATREWRTGVTKQGQGIDANALQNQTAQAVAQVMSMAQARQKLIARIFAETGVRDLFSLLHATIRKNDREENTIRLRNRWVTVNPRDWKLRNDMTINVGLGSGSKQQQIAFFMEILNIQKEAILHPELGLVDPENIYNALKKLVELAGHKSVEPYFSDPSGPPKIDPATGQPKEKPQAPVDPKVQAAQQQMQLDQQIADAKLQQQQKALDAQMAAKQQQAALDLETNRQKIAAEMEMHRQKLAMEAQARQDQLAAETNLKSHQINTEAQLRREQINADQQTTILGAAIDHHAKVTTAKATSVGQPVELGGQIG